MVDRRAGSEERQRDGQKQAAAQGQRLKGHLALVTGADSGIGKATAIAFAREGADVVITYHNDEQGAREAEDEAKAAGVRTLVMKLDHTKPDEVRRVFREVAAELGVPTLLVNNAGIGGIGKKIRDIEDDEWDKVIRTDLYGAFYCSREFLRTFDKLNQGAAKGQRAKGCIINVTSVHEEIVLADSGAYNVAKAGLRNLTRTLAMELAEQGIRVNNLAPGMVLTPMNQEAMDDASVRKDSEKNIPVKRAAKPEEIASAAVFLASDEASYVHGTTLFVDGGLMLNVGQGA